MVFSIDTSLFVPINMSKKPMIYVDRFKYLGEDIEKNKKFINQNYYNNSMKIRNFIPNSLLIDIEKKNLVSSATFQDLNQHKKNLENFFIFWL